MSNEQETPTRLGKTEGEEGASEVQQDDAESVEAICDRVDSKVEDILQDFDLIVDLREHKITELEEGLAPRRLLVVDDAKSTIDVLKAYLKGQPIEVVGCSGDSARDLLASSEYDVVLIEATVVIEPNVDGLAFSREFCVEGRGRSVIVMSSRPGERIKKSVEEAGAAFLRKPFKGLELMQRIQHSLVGNEK